MTDFIPLNGHLVVEIHEAKGRTDAGILLPDSVCEKPLTGSLVAKAVDVDIPIQKGDTVLFTKYSGTKVTICGRDYLVVKSDLVIGYSEQIVHV